MTSHGMDQDKLRRGLDALLSGWTETGALPCITAQVRRRGQVVYEGAFGKRDLASGADLQKTDIFRIYSMTKVFTSVAMLMLHERGLYQMWDPVSKFFPEYKDIRVAQSNAAGHIRLVPPRREMVIRDLFTMTSGMPYPGGDTPAERGMEAVWDRFWADAKAGKFWSTQKFCREAASAPLTFHPGEHWWYGQSFEILGGLVEVLSGKRLGEFYDENILQPLGMEDTAFFVPPEKWGRFVSAYRPDGQGKWELTGEEESQGYRHDDPFEGGGGGLVSTLEDVSRFAQALANWGEYEGNRLLSRKSIELMRRNHLDPAQMIDFDWPNMRGYGYGLGVRTMQRPELAGYGSPGEFGWSGAAGTYFAMDPEEQMSLVYLVQIMPGREDIFAPPILQNVYGAMVD